MPVCREIVAEGCSHPVEASWTFCAACGHRLGSLAFGAPRVEAQGDAGSIEVPFAREGWASVRLATRLVGDAGGRARGVSAPDRATGSGSVVVRYAGADASAYEASVGYRTDSVRREATNLWLPDELGEERILGGLAVRREEEGRIELEPAVLPLGSRTPKRRFAVVNAGGRALRVRTPTLPPGFRLREAEPSPSGLHTVYPGGGRVEFEAERVEAGAPGSSVRLEDEAGSAVASLSLLSLPELAATEVAQFYIGVDFGTSNTSIVVYDSYNEDRRLLPYPGVYAKGFDDEFRWPTVIGLRGGEATWTYGYEAAAEISADTRYPILRELKTMLRRETLPLIGGTGVDAGEVAAWYFERLLRDVVEPHLAGVVPGVTPTVEFVLSLPVLDSGEEGMEAGRQRDRTLAAFRRALERAGFPEGTRVTTVSEPVAAATYILQSYLKDGSAFGATTVGSLADGDLVGIYDSGGGTTDVVLFRVDLKTTPIGMRELRQFGTTSFEAEDTRAGRLEKTFGGEVVTREVGLRIALRTRMAKIPITYHLDREARYTAPDKEGRKMPSFDAAHRFVKGQDGRDHIVATVSEGGAGSVESWTTRFPSLYGKIESLKKDLTQENLRSNTDGVSKLDLAIELNEGDADPIYGDPTRYRSLEPAEAFREYRVKAEDLEATLDSHVPAILDEIDRLARESFGGALKCLIVVGGNTRLEPMMAMLRKRYGSRLVVGPAAERSHAVAEGTVTSVATRLERPDYALILRDAEGKDLDVIAPDRLLTEDRKGSLYSLPAYGHTDLELHIGTLGKTALAHRVRVANDAPEPKRIKISYGLEKDKYVVRSETQGREGVRDLLVWPL